MENSGFLFSVSDFHSVKHCLTEHVFLVLVGHFIHQTDKSAILLSREKYYD